MKKYKEISCKKCGTKCISGKRSLCNNCYVKEQKAKARLQKAKDKRTVKRQLITEKKLDIVFSKLVKTIYPFVCHASGVSLVNEVPNAAHLIGRACRCTRWDLRNCYPTTAYQNMVEQTHVIHLARKLESYYFIPFDIYFSEAKKSTCKLTAEDRRMMFEVFNEALKRLDTITSDKEKTLIRLDVIEKTKLIC